MHLGGGVNLFEDSLDPSELLFVDLLRLLRLQLDRAAAYDVFDTNRMLVHMLAASFSCPQSFIASDIKKCSFESY